MQGPQREGTAKDERQDLELEKPYPCFTTSFLKFLSSTDDRHEEKKEGCFIPFQLSFFEWKAARETTK